MYPEIRPLFHYFMEIIHDPELNCNTYLQSKQKDRAISGKNWHFSCINNR